MYDISCKFHLAPESPWHDAGNALEALRPYAQLLGERDPTLKRGSAATRLKKRSATKRSLMA